MRLTAALAVAAILAVMLLLRWEVSTVQRGDGAPVAYKLDRWTGDVVFLHHDAAYPVAPAKR